MRHATSACGPWEALLTKGNGIMLACCCRRMQLLCSWKHSCFGKLQGPGYGGLSCGSRGDDEAVPALSSRHLFWERRRPPLILDALTAGAAHSCSLARHLARMTYDSEQEEDERFWEEYSAQHHEVFTPKERLQLPQKLCDPRAALLTVVGGGFALLVCRALRRRKPSQQQRPAAAAAPTSGGRRRIVGKRAGGSSEARAEGGSSKDRAEGGSIKGDNAYIDAFSEDDGSDGEAGDGDGQASGLLSRSDIDTAAWGALLGGRSTHWAQLCESAQKDCGAPHARRCCRPLPANLKGSGLLVGGQEVLVVDYLHCDLAAHVSGGEGRWGVTAREVAWHAVTCDRAGPAACPQLSLDCLAANSLVPAMLSGTRHCCAPAIKQKSACALPQPLSPASTLHTHGTWQVQQQQQSTFEHHFPPGCCAPWPPPPAGG